MSTSAPASPSPASGAKPFCPIERLKPFLNVYYLTIAAILGGVTTVFVALIAVLILIATNFNVLGWIE